MNHDDRAKAIMLMALALSATSEQTPPEPPHHVAMTVPAAKVARRAVRRQAVQVYQPVARYYQPAPRFFLPRAAQGQDCGPSG